MREVVIVDACRSPIGRAGDRGVYRAFTGRDIMKPVIKAIIARNKLDPNMIDDVTLGSATGGWGGRIQGMIADLPWSVGGSSVERACGSSSTAIAIAATSILNGDADIMLALGLETMDRNTVVQPWQVGQRGAPQGFSLGGAGLTPEQAAAKYPDGWKTGADLISPLPPNTPPWFMNMGMTAEELAKRYNILKADMDAFSVRSHVLATKAQDDGIFKDEIIPITLKYTDGTSEVVNQDQIPRRDTTLEKVAALKPSFKDDGLITAGNSSPRSDGAGAVLLMSKDMAKKLKMRPLVTFRHGVACGVDPAVMGIGPVPATKKLLARTGMKITDFDIMEVNEAFACVPLYFIREMGVSKENIAKINPYGGAIAIGHPLGMTGTRQAAVVARHLNRTGGRWGLATLCCGGGQGFSTLFERENYDW